MNTVLIAVSLFLFTLTLTFAYIAFREKEKRKKTIYSLRQARRRRSDRKTDSTKLLSRALNLLREGIVVMDPYGRIIFTNRFARELLDISPED